MSDDEDYLLEGNLETLFHLLKLNGYAFKKTERLTQHESNHYQHSVQAVFIKKGLYADDEDMGYLKGLDISVFVEFDVLNKLKPPDHRIRYSHVKNGKVVQSILNYYYDLTEQEEFVDELRESPGISNLSVSNVRMIPNKRGDVEVSNVVSVNNDPFANDDRYAIDELQILFQILNLHDYKYEKTKRLTPFESSNYDKNIQSVFTKTDAPIRVKIEFPMEVDPTNAFYDPVFIVNYDDIEDGKVVKGEMEYYYDINKAQHFIEDLIDAPAAKGGGGKKTRNNKGKTKNIKKQSRKSKGKNKGKTRKK